MEDLKQDWVITKIDNIGEIITGNTPSKANPSFYSNKDFPFYKPTDLEAGVNVKSSSDGLSEEGFKNSRIAKEGSILVTCIGATIGKSGLIKKNGAFNQQINGIVPYKIIDSKFLYFQVIGLEFQQKIKENASSTTLPILNKSKFSILEIRFAPLPIQRAIVLKIENLFASLDKGIADLEKAQQQLKVYRQAVLKKAFEGEFTKGWREKNICQSSFEFLQELSNNRLKIKLNRDSIYLKKVSHEFKFVKDKKINTWSRGTLDKLIYISARIGWRGLKKDEYTETGPLFLSVHSLNHGKYVDYSQAYHLSIERYNESPEIQLEEGDVLLCKDGAGIGKIGIVKNLPTKATVNSSLLVIRGMQVLDQEFLYYLFSGPELQKIVFERITGSATPHLFQNDISKFELLIPPIIEQHQIVRAIESRLSVCDKVEQSISESLEKSKALRQSILKKAFEGKLLSVAEIAQCKQEKDYEPASVLLERIRKDRACPVSLKNTKK